MPITRKKVFLDSKIVSNRRVNETIKLNAKLDAQQILASSSKYILKRMLTANLRLAQITQSMFESVFDEIKEKLIIKIY
ncbi:hypothetical protein TTHERM_00414500 (macronuclear) [Tetrahymena thermophila SB210]|uniref:Transmembrane protein n=1 Tax=Tetrahymena thermophila (strain SB210) TaxID=312017 RepID=Q22P41_TETTS|nr:hypothetical protein TTHERM_00414500 [Tetrahymena thermophila SB210]EAR86970.1 hypothetical protein TTHERM_00414500 [Tetrahymena thermophila SB210]|eukprot:XP_001007215.1 hypothetical protein TTHERM_00414500 [Tetrahymena thermophila SB210]